MNANTKPHRLKKCLVLATGGTIASSPSADGSLSPSVGIADVLRRAGDYPGIGVDAVDMMSVDSSNIQPEEWVAIARRITDARQEYSGIVLTHGTDTMAYTASALSFMLRGIGIPVVLTGSQLPVTDPLSDAPGNLHAALAVASSPGLRGVYVCFNRRVMLGCRTVKVRTESFDAFESINYPAVGNIDGRGLELAPPRPMTCPPEKNNKEDFSFGIDTRVFLVKLTPGFDPAVFDMLRRMDYRGIVIEAFGAGGIQFIRRDLGAEIRSLTADGVPVVVASQCLYEPADPGIYEVGRRALESGAVSARDMTTEAAVTKLMWALPRATASGDTVGLVRRLFDTNIAGEVSI